MQTALNATLPEDERKDVLNRIWLQRFGGPAEVAKVCASSRSLVSFSAKTALSPVHPPEEM